MNYDEFRDVDELTSEDLAGREIEQIMAKKSAAEKKLQKQPQKKETTEPQTEDQEPEKKPEEKTQKPEQKEQKKELEKEPQRQPKKPIPEIQIQKKTATKTKKTVAIIQKIKKIPAKTEKIQKTNAAKKQKPQKQAKKTITAKKTKPPKKTSKQTTDWLIIIITAIVILAIVIGLYFWFKSATSKQGADTVAAIVNGEPVYNSEINSRINIINQTENPRITREETLNATINQRLILQEAGKKGIKVTDKEVEEMLKNSLERNGLTLEGYKKDLEKSGLKYEEVIKYYKDNLLSYKYVNETIIKKIIIIDEDAERFYEENPELFIMPEQVQIRHILAGFDTENDTDTLNKTKEIEKKILSDKSNFCELVKKYSDDKGSTETCGEYNFSEQDPYVPEFKEAGFSMKKNEIKTIKTQFGYHIMYKLSEIPETKIPYDQVKERIKQELERKQTIEEYEKTMKELREKAIIEIYPDQKQQKDQTGASIIKAEPLKKEIIKTIESEKQSLAKCLSDKGAKMYTVYWSPFNEEQLSIFGTEADSIKTIECDKNAENTNYTECERLGIKTYPSWTVNGKLLEGIQSARGLTEASGCENI